MAQQIHVTGPCKLQVDNAGGDTFVDLGMTASDGLITFHMTDVFHDVNTVTFGKSPENIVYQGTTAVIEGSLSFWDEDVWNATTKRIRGGASAPGGYGDIGTLSHGTDLQSVGFAVSLKILPTTAGLIKIGYKFSGNCILIDEGERFERFGNVERRLHVRFRAITYNGALYTEVIVP